MLMSVVIPLYNKELSISGTLRSVLAQTYIDYEILVVNDGSTDTSAEVVRQMMIEDNRIRLIEQPNAGVSAARNTGILNARGEYIAFLDADDLWTSDYLETLDKLIHDFPDAGLYCIGYWAIQDSQMFNGLLPSIQESGRIRGRVDNPWRGNTDLFAGSSSSSRERLIRVGLFDTRMTHGEDLDLFWRVVLDGGMVRDSKCCAFYRMDSENRAMRRFPPLEKLIVSYVDKYAEARAANNEFRRFFDKEMIYRLYPYLLNKEYAEDARKIAKQFDYGQLKWSMRFRMQCPKLYYYIKKYISRSI